MAHRAWGIWGMLTMMTIRLMPLACLAALAGPAIAHDLWIEPSSYHVAPTVALRLGLRVGQDFKGDALPRNGSLIEKFALFGPEGERTAIGQDGGDPAGFAKPESPGLHTAVYFSRFSTVELEGAKFERYLKDEGLDVISRVRATKGESAKPAKDRFLRCAKTLIHVGEGGDAGFNRVFGLPLELVAESDPWTANEPLRIKLLWHGKALKGALVVAFSKANPTHKIQLRTDHAGRVSLPMGGPGVWLVKCVHMEAAGSGEPLADWESYWASLSFERKA